MPFLSGAPRPKKNPGFRGTTTRLVTSSTEAGVTMNLIDNSNNDNNNNRTNESIYTPGWGG